jgi:hypothetical protein
MDPDSGQISGSFGMSGSALGLTFDGMYILTSEYAVGNDGIVTERIYQFDPRTFANVGSFTLTADTGAGFDATPVYGVARHNGEILLSYQEFDKLLRFDAAGNVVGTIQATVSVVGIAFIGEELFVGDRGAGAVYRYVHVVPEPSTLFAICSGLLSLAMQTPRSRHITGWG